MSSNYITMYTESKGINTGYDPSRVATDRKIIVYIKS